MDWGIAGALLALAGCGPEPILPDDAAPKSDATLPPPSLDGGAAEGAMMAVVAVVCEGVYFIEISGEAGTTILRGGLDEGGAPAKTCVPLGEDCPGSTAIAGSNETDWLVLSLQNSCNECPPLTIGSWNGSASLDENGSAWFGYALIRVTGVSPTAARGDYKTVVTESDGGARELHGTFCVHP